MLLESKLNEYEYDWASAVFREKNLNLNKISDMTIVVSGSSMLARAIIIAFLFANDKKKLGNRIYLVSDNYKEVEFLSYFSDRNDFKAFNFFDFKQYVDIWIEADCLSYDNVYSAKTPISLFENADKLVNLLSTVKPKNFILLSDTAVYGSLPKGFAASECEYFSDDSLITSMVRCVENLFVSAACQYGFDYQIIRKAMLLSALSDSKNINNLVDNIAVGNSFNIKKSNKKLSYISINDFITALFYVIIYGKKNTVFNASADKPVTLNELFVVVDELFEDCEVSLSDNGLELFGCAVKNDKLKKLGWSAQLDVKDALLIAKHERLNNNQVFMFEDAYDGKLSAIQNVLLAFLLEVDRICKKHNIKYFLGGGSLLGAIRHKGFIPWDDDADVMMLREDYDKFLKVLPNELSDKFSYQSYKSKEPNHFPFTKIRINNTILSTEFTSGFDYLHQGIFLDVLAQDKTSNNKIISKIHMRLTAAFRWLVLDKWRGKPVKGRSKASSFVANVLKAVLPMSFLEFMQNKLMVLYKDKKDCKYLYDSMGRNIGNGAFPAQWLDEAIWVDFENTKMPVPKEYDKYLTYLYGDYMNMIPVSKRHVSHDIVQIDLGEYNSFRLESKL